MMELAEVKAKRKGVARSVMLRQMLADGLNWSEEVPA